VPVSGPRNASSSARSFRRNSPAVHNLGAGDDSLGFEQSAEGLNAGVGDRQVVLELGKVLGGGGTCPRQPAHTILETGDTFEDVLLEIFLGLDEELIADFMVGVGDAGQHQELVAAAMTEVLLARIGRSAVLAEHLSILVVGEEAATGLAAQPARIHHLH